MFRLRELGVDAFRVDPDKMVKGLMPQVRLDVYFPGFPTLKHIPHKVNILSHKYTTEGAICKFSKLKDT